MEKHQVGKQHQNTLKPVQCSWNAPVPLDVRHTQQSLSGIGALI